MKNVWYSLNSVKHCKKVLNAAVFHIHPPGGGVEGPRGWKGVAFTPWPWGQGVSCWPPEHTARGWGADPLKKPEGGDPTPSESHKGVTKNKERHFRVNLAPKFPAKSPIFFRSRLRRSRNPCNSCGESAQKTNPLWENAPGAHWVFEGACLLTTISLPPNWRFFVEGGNSPFWKSQLGGKFWAL